MKKKKISRVVWTEFGWWNLFRKRYAGFFGYKDKDDCIFLCGESIKVRITVEEL